VSALHRLEQRLQHKAAQVHSRMGQNQAGMFDPQLTPKQQVKIQWSGPPALLFLTIAAAALLPALQLLKQLERCHFRRRSFHARDQKDGIAISALAWRPPDRLGLQKRGTPHISRIGITPVHKHLSQARCDPTQRGFRRAMTAAQVGPKSNGKR
jgi:hypothetical protein